MEHNHEFEGGHEHRHDHDHGPEHSKYEEALAKYNIRLHDEDVKAKTALLIEKHVAENNTPDVKKFLFHCIDLTTLKCTDSDESVMKFTGKVNEFVDKYPDLDNVALSGQSSLTLSSSQFSTVSLILLNGASRTSKL